MEVQGLPPKPKIGELLTAQGIIGPSELEKGLGEQRRVGVRIGEALVSLKLLSETELAQGLSSQLGLPFFDLTLTHVSPEALLLIPKNLAQKHLAVPIQVDGKFLTVAMVDPLSYDAMNDLMFYCGYTVRPVISTKGDVLKAIDRHYPMGGSEYKVTPVGEKGEIEKVKGDLPFKNKGSQWVESLQEAPVVQKLDGIINRAIYTGASDIHLEPHEGELVVRFRLDGILQRVNTLPKWFQGPLTSRIKVLSKLDIAEKRRPQDGAFRIHQDKGGIDIRVATLPTQYGEKVVMRILDPFQFSPSLDHLGFSHEDLTTVKRLLESRSGIILVTGPTGSGKTTTLYAMVKALRDESRNIVTVEDPIEYSIEGINQTQVNAEIGLTFANCLRSILRQDPNIILLGEIRDFETAEIAFRAAVTGHLVLSTLHTRDAPSSVIRLIDLGVPRYLVSSLLVGVIAQRLVRFLCSFCRVEDFPSPSSLVKLGFSKKNMGDMTFYRGGGCSSCGGNGYKGRLGLYEVMALNQKLKDMILQEASEAEIRAEAMGSGMSLLGEEGLKHVKLGQTALPELLRVVDLESHLPKFCQGCGEPVSAHFGCCPFCSKSLHIGCGGCGKPMRAAWKVCPYCSRPQ